MKLFKQSPEGDPESGIIVYYLIEWKKLFSIVFLKFNKGAKNTFHSHAFNALTWWIKGEVEEHHYPSNNVKKWFPSIFPKYTHRNCFHKVIAKKISWAISLRGPWKDTWMEHKNNETYVLKQGRIKVDKES